MFKIEFATDNDAFHPNARMEVMAILRDTITKVDMGENGGNIRDENGNTIGAWQIIVPEGQS